MKQIFFAIFLIVLGFGALAQDIPPRPNPPVLVNDLVGLLDPGQRQALENKLDVFDDSTSVQIAVVIISSTSDYDPVDYAVKLGRTWGVGNKQFNNGVVFLVAKDDHKVFIAPGYGLEGALPDITCKSIIDNFILPPFKEGNFYAGIDSGVNNIMLASKGEYKAPAGYHKQSSAGGWTVFFLIFFIILMIIIIRRGGGGGGGYISRRGYGPLFWGAVGGSLLGGDGGGRGGGGDSGGGGFGGFGGGSFGGGGAGGSW